MVKEMFEFMGVVLLIVAAILGLVVFFIVRSEKGPMPTRHGGFGSMKGGAGS